MGVKNHILKRYFGKRTRHYLGAIIAAAVTSFVAMNMLSKAWAQDCSLSVAMEWQRSLNSTDIEQSPEHISEATEAFLNTCPARPEFFEASRIAGMAAADLGDLERAAQHFENAGPMTERLANFYAISTFLAVDKDRIAWRTRDRLVEAWRSRLERASQVSLSAEPVAGGMIYQVFFQETDKNTGIRAAWVAVPTGPGWPATLTFSRDPMRLAFRKVRTGAAQSDLRYVDFHRCFARRSLGEITTKLTSTEFDAAARASLTAYLANPDQHTRRTEARLEVCYSPARLLPDVPKN